MESSKEEKLKKLMALKQDYARKKKKLEKCKHAAQVKAHVRQKIKEHKEIEQQTLGLLQTCDNETSQCNAVTASISACGLTNTKVSANEGSHSHKPSTAHNATLSLKVCVTECMLDDIDLSPPGKMKKETFIRFREQTHESSWIDAGDKTATVNTSEQNNHITETKKDPVKLINGNWLANIKDGANVLHSNKGNPVLHAGDVKIIKQADRCQVESSFSIIEQTGKPEDQFKRKLMKSSKPKNSFNFLCKTEHVHDQHLQIQSTAVNEKPSMKDASEHLNTLSSRSSIWNQDKTKLIPDTYQTEHSTGGNFDMKPPMKKRKLTNSSESEDEIIMASQFSTGLVYQLASSAYRLNVPNKLSHSNTLPTTPTFENINMSPNWKVDDSLYSISNSEFLNILGVTPNYDSKKDSKKKSETNEISPKPQPKRFDKLSLTKISKLESDSYHNSNKLSNSICEQIFNQGHLEHVSGHIIPETEAFDSQGSFLRHTELDFLPFSQTSQSFSKAFNLGMCVNRRSPRISAHYSEGSTASSNSSVFSSKSSQLNDRNVASLGVKLNKRSLAQQKKVAAILSVFQFLIDEAVKPKWVSEFQLPVSFTELIKINETLLNGPKSVQDNLACELNSNELVMTQSKTGQSLEVISLKPEVNAQSLEVISLKPEVDLLSRFCNEDNNFNESFLPPVNVTECVKSEQFDMLASLQENCLSLEQQNIKQGSSLATLFENEHYQSDSQISADKASTKDVAEGSELETCCWTTSPKSQNSLNGVRNSFEQQLDVLTDSKETTNAVDMVTSEESEMTSQQVIKNKMDMIITKFSLTNPVNVTSNVTSPNVSMSCGNRNNSCSGHWKNSETPNIKTAKSNHTVANQDLLGDVQSPSVCQDELALSYSDVIAPCSPLIFCTSPQPDAAIKYNQATPSMGTPSPVVPSVMKRNAFSLTSTPKTTRSKSFASRINMSSYMKNSKLLLECNKDLDRSETSLEICSPNPRCPKSVGHESPNNLEPIVFSPHLHENSYPKINRIKYASDVMSPNMSTNVSNVLQFDDSYLSPGQIPVNTPVESFTNHLGSSIDCSMLLVEPWKKLPRTPTTPLQVLEDKSAQNSHVPVVFTPTRRISRSQTNENSYKEERTLKFSGCFQSCSQDAVVSVLSGQLKLESGVSMQFIVSVQATSLTVWTEDDHFGWTTELDWRLAPDIHIMKAALLPVSDRIAVVASGLDKGHLFLSLFVYICSSEDTKRFNIPLTEFQTDLNLYSQAELCVASVTELLIGLSTDSSHFVGKVIFSDDLNTILFVSKFDRQPGQLLNLVMVKNLASAFMILSTDQNISIWNTKLGSCLKRISLPSSIPCLTGMIAAKAYQGFLILDTIWRVDNGDCGGIVILNPVTCKSYPVVAFPSPNSSWRRTENAQKDFGFVTALNDRGSLCIWERKTGKIVGHTKSNWTTCASLMASNKTLLAGEIHGCLHLYRTS